MDKLAELDRLVQALLCVFGLGLPLLAIAAFAWSAFAPDHLYDCWDDVPFVTCIPPFVHPWANSGKLVDYYIWPGWAVYSLWFGAIALTFVLHAFLAWLVFRPWCFDEKSTVLTL